MKFVWVLPMPERSSPPVDVFKQKVCYPATSPYDGSARDPRFVLENTPDSRKLESVATSSENAVLTNNISTRFRADHTTISFGPTLQREIAKSWNLQAGAGISLHWLHWSAVQNEKLTVAGNSGSHEFASWQDSSSGDRILSGIYLQVGSEWMPEGQQWSIKSFLRADFGSSSSLSIGPSEITYDVDGFTAAVMVSHAL